MVRGWSDWKWLWVPLSRSYKTILQMCNWCSAREMDQWRFGKTEASFWISVVPYGCIQSSVIRSHKTGSTMGERDLGFDPFPALSWACLVCPFWDITMNDEYHLLSSKEWYFSLAGFPPPQYMLELQRLQTIFRVDISMCNASCDFKHLVIHDV